MLANFLGELDLAFHEVHHSSELVLIDTLDESCLLWKGFLQKLAKGLDTSLHF